MQRIFLFYSIILIEGYVVLASELLAIRQLLPFVGSGTETVAIIIAAVLMPLAFGYYVGGKFKPQRKRKFYLTIRKKLIYNVLNAGIILCIGLSYIFLELFFTALNNLGITHRIAQTTIFSVIFLVYPVFLLGQTVPLISNYFSKEKLSKITGKMLFFSTTGSFLGSIVSTLILMATIGVHNTVIVTLTLLAIVILLLTKKATSINTVYATIIIAITVTLNNDSVMESLNIVENNNYSTIQIVELPKEHARMMRINRSQSSKYSDYFELMFDYIKYVETTFIRPTLSDNSAPKSILVIGAGGFTLAIEDTKNHYTFIDIDKSLKHISEEYLLPEAITPNKKFVAQPARAFLNHNTEKFDLIFIDAYTNVHDIPQQLITKEFFAKVKNTLKPGGIVVFNAIVSPRFQTDFSIKLDNTLRTAFPHITRHASQAYNAWSHRPVNMIYSYVDQSFYTDEIYTDDLNTYYLDR